MWANHLAATYSPRFCRMTMSLAGDEDILSSSVAGISSIESVNSGGVPVRHGLYDLRLGAFAGKYECHTCGLDIQKCPGHLGHAKLNNTLVQPIAHGEILKWLKIICIRCSSLIIDTNSEKFKRAGRTEKLQVASELSASKTTCPNCGYQQPKVKQSHTSAFVYETIPVGGLHPITMYPKDLKIIFDKIPDAIVRSLGRHVDSHPRNYFVTTMTVSPTNIRPYIKLIGASKGHRPLPLTEFTKNLIKLASTTAAEDKANTCKMNILLYDMIKGGSRGISEEQAEKDKDRGPKEQNSIGGSLSDSLLKGLGGKHGEIRNQTLAHRSFNTSRLVISCNQTTCKVDCLMVPRYILSTLNIAETVSDFNYTRLLADVMAGRCNRIRKKGESNDRNVTEKMRFNIVLQPGDVVYRFMYNGDRINFNRQPSLRESAIGSHRVVPLEDSTVNTYQMNVSAAKNYNADFDGDAMGAKPPRTPCSRAEAEYLSSVARHSLSTQHSTFTCGAVLDTVIGSFMLTKGSTRLDKLHAIRCFQNCGFVNPPSFTKDLYTGRDLVSIILEKTPITYKNKSSFYDEARAHYIHFDPDEYNIEIINGVHKRGIIDNKAIGTYITGSIFHIIAREYDTAAALDVMYIYQQVASAFATMHGFTISVGDIVISKESIEKIEAIIEAQVVSSNQYAEQYMRGEIYPPLGRTVREHYEDQQMAILGKSSDVLGHILKSLDTKTNCLYQMVYHDAKGSGANFFSILSNVGQMTLMDGRIPDTFSRYRGSVYHPRYSLSPESRGFITSSFTRGLRHDEMCVAAMQARENLVRKSQSTAISGTQSRIQNKNLESCIVTYYRQVMKSHMMIQLLYGESGIDQRYLVEEKFETVMMSDTQVKETFKESTPEEIKQLIADRDRFRKYAIHLAELKIHKFTGSIRIPFKIGDLISRSILLTRSPTKDVDKVMNIINNFINNLPYVFSNSIQEEKKTRLPEQFVMATFLMQMLIRIQLNRGVVMKISERKIVKSILPTIRLRYMSTFVDPGLVCGIVACQSFNEPQVQKMLNALHGKAVGAIGGIDRIKQILGVKKTSNLTKVMILPLRAPYDKDETAAKELAMKLIGVTFEVCVSDWQIFFETHPVHPRYKHENDIIKKFEASSYVKKPANITKWCIRFELNAQEMMLKMIDLDDIIKILYSTHPNIYIVNTSEASDAIIVRIYLLERELMRRTNIEQYVCTEFMQKIMSTHIRGIHDFLNCKVKQEKIYTVSDDNSIKEEMINAIHVNGCNLEGLVEMFDNETSPIDLSSIHINDIPDTYSVYGIEATRYKIYEQLNNQESIAYAHTSLYTDTMCWSGTPIPLQKCAMKEQNNTCLLMSSQAAGRVVVNSTLTGIDQRIDHSIASQVFFGQTPAVGTNYMQLSINEEFVVANAKTTISQLKSLV